MKSQIISDLKSIIAIYGGFEVDNLVISNTGEMIEVITYTSLDYFETAIICETTKKVKAVNYGKYEELELSTLNSLLKLINYKKK